MPALRKCLVQAAFFPQAAGTLMKPSQRALGLSKVLAREERHSHTNPGCWINQQRYYAACRVSEGRSREQVSETSSPEQRPHGGGYSRAQPPCMAHTVGNGPWMLGTPQLCPKPLSQNGVHAAQVARVLFGRPSLSWVSKWLSLGFMPCCKGVRKASISL